MKIKPPEMDQKLWEMTQQRDDLANLVSVVQRRAESAEQALSTALRERDQARAERDEARAAIVTSQIDLLRARKDKEQAIANVKHVEKLLTKEGIPTGFEDGNSWDDLDFDERVSFLGKEINALRTQLADATRAREGAECLATKLGELFGIGEKARTHSVILTNARNASRRSQCLTEVERFFTTREVEEEGEDEVEICALNWGDTPERYAERFREALTARLAAVVSAGDGLAKALEKSKGYVPLTHLGILDECKSALAAWAALQ